MGEGDINDSLGDIPEHDLLTAGFPCQPFSSAGKKRGIKDPRGTLFSTVVELLRTRRPRFFVLENVKRLLTMEEGVHFATILASLAALDYRIEWRLINAVDLGLAQNRERVLIVGVRRDAMESRRDSGIRLASTSDLANASKLDTHALRNVSEWSDLSIHTSKFPNWGIAESGRFYGISLQAFSLAKPPASLCSILESEVDDSFDFTESTLKRLTESTEVHRYVAGVEILSNQSGGARMGYTVFGINGVAPTLTCTASRHYERYKIGGQYRRLTNVEYARLQGFPDDHCSIASVYSQYALFGNAVPPPMARWAIERVISEPLSVADLPNKDRQRRLFTDAV